MYILTRLHSPVAGRSAEDVRMAPERVLQKVDAEGDEEGNVRDGE